MVGCCTHRVSCSVVFLFHLKLLPDMLSVSVLDSQGSVVVPKDLGPQALSWGCIERAEGDLEQFAVHPQFFGFAVHP
jgi:hypothetical protein